MWVSNITCFRITPRDIGIGDIFSCLLARHCWRSRDELISDIFLWTPSHGRAKAGWPARTDIQQLCANTGCSLEDLPKAMDDREDWQEWVRDIRADGTTWWWWYYLPTPPLGQDMTQGQFFFLSGVKQVWIQSFPSPRLVA